MERIVQIADDMALMSRKMTGLTLQLRKRTIESKVRRRHAVDDASRIIVYLTYGQSTTQDSLSMICTS